MHSSTKISKYVRNLWSTPLIVITAQPAYFYNILNTRCGYFTLSPLPWPWTQIALIEPRKFLCLLANLYFHYLVFVITILFLGYQFELEIQFLIKEMDCNRINPLQYNIVIQIVLIAEFASLLIQVQLRSYNYIYSLLKIETHLSLLHSLSYFTLST